MTIPAQIAKQWRDLYFGGNWTAVNMKDTLADVGWHEAVEKVNGLNTIAMLVFHVNYYINPMLKVLQGGALEAHDKFSYDVPAIGSEADWQKLVTKVFTEAEIFAAAIETLDEDLISESFADSKYGTYFRNLAGVIEHTNYHLGQMVILKKLLRAGGV